MKSHNYFLLVSLLSFCLNFNLSAQKEVAVFRMKTSPVFPFQNPIMLDSVDVQLKKFETKNLLQNAVDFETVRKSTTVVNAEIDSIFTLGKMEKDTDVPDKNKALQLLSFHIDADRYCKSELIIKSAELLEVYVNGKKEKSKETQEDNFSKAQELKIDLSLEPRNYEVIIKRIVDSEKETEPQMKIVIKLNKENESAQISLPSDTAKRRLNINDIMDGTRAYSSGISPDGEYYLINIRTVLPGGKNSYNNELRELKDNRIVYRFPSGISPRWFNDKSQLIYSRSGLNDKDIVVFDIPSLQETVIAGDIKFDSFRISPDGQTILISQKTEIPADKGDLKRVLSPGDRSGSFRERSSLFLYTVADKTFRQITFGQTRIYPTDIRRDSKKVLLLASEETITQRPFRKYTLFEMDLQTWAVDTLLESSSIHDAQYSPDMKSLLLVGDADAFDGIGQNLSEEQIANTYDRQVFIYNLSDKTVAPITKNFDPSVESANWSVYDNQIYFRVEDKDSINVYSYDTKGKKYTRLDLPEEVINSFSVSEKKPIAVFRGQSNANSSRVYSYNLKSKKTTLLADPFKNQLDELDLTAAKSWTFTSSSSTVIDGRYYLPPNFDSDKKYPLIVYYYGGTSPTSRTFESGYPLQVYAALGYVVYTLQPSGTTGYGQEFSARHVNAWGRRTADEIIEGTLKFCEEHPFVDSDKIGCVGASYGGFMTQYLQTQTDIFAAAVSHAGISSIASYWGEGYWGLGYSAVASANSYPWNNPDLYVKQSPLFQADKINTPLLLLHGTVDTNVPIGESIQMYNALKILGKEVELIQVEGENHGVSDYKKRIEWNKTIYAWFAKWLKGQPEWWNALYPEK
ncbi:MAG: S9 family peptidase [Dysgonamonadaceae bacterium]|jgi:dipeptidyl aminopeptidase/acylaminoacyl peptidase|nr:S9 family peptidase [Dysgonamonadaceae bacterium]